MAKGRMKSKARLISFCMMALFLSGCSERLTEYYPKYEDAVKDGAVKRGWIPEIAPTTACFTTIKTGRALSTYCKERSLTIEMKWLRIMGREWVGPRIGAPRTGLRIEDRRRRWKSQSI